MTRVIQGQAETKKLENHPTIFLYQPLLKAQSRAPVLGMIPAAIQVVYGAAETITFLACAIISRLAGFLFKSKQLKKFTAKTSEHAFISFSFFAFGAINLMTLGFFSPRFFKRSK